jgi:Sulfotransferase family
MKRTIKQAASSIDIALRRVQLDLNPDPAAAVVVAGTGRSGTAWVANIVNYANEYRYLFEPFNPYKTQELRHFRYRQYLRPSDEDPTFVLPARLVLSGAVRNPWVDQFNRRIVSRRRVIPEIRANLMLKWMRERFPQTPIVWLMRHPCADANSRMRLGWQTHLDEILNQPPLLDDHVGQFRDRIANAATEFERHIYLWCVENYVPFRQLAPHDVHVAYYENFCERPKFEFDRLFKYLKRPYNRDVFSQLYHPTVLSREESAIVTGSNLIDAWRTWITPEQIERAIEILAQFGLDRLYGSESMPKVTDPWAAGGPRPQPSRI